MSKGVKSRLSNITEALIAADRQPATPRVRGSGATSAPVALAAFSVDYQALERKVEELQAREGQPMMLALDLIDDGPFHTSPINPTRVAALRANLAVNPQSTPAVVRRKGDGRYEFVSGRHRRAALRDLQRNEMAVVVKEFSDDEAQRLVLFDNMFAPNLSDFEKYRGFEARQKSTKKTQKALAEEAGVSPAYVSYVFAFEELPPEALQALEAKPDVLTYRSAKALAKLLPEKQARVIEAVQLLVAGDERVKDAAAAVAWAAREEEAKPKPKAAAPVVVRSGRSKFAEVVSRNGAVTVRLADAGMAQSVQESILELLRKMAKDPAG